MNPKTELWDAVRRLTQKGWWLGTIARKAIRGSIGLALIVGLICLAACGRPSQRVQNVSEASSSNGGAPQSSRPTVSKSEPQSGIGLMCDPSKFRFSIRALITPAELDRSYPIAKVIPVGDLFFAGGLPGWTGEIDLRGPLIRYERCGPYTFKLEGDAYNMNVQGESGAYDAFASVLVLRGTNIIYPKRGETVRLTACDRELPRARGCPDGYAVRLDGRYDAAQKDLKLTETASSFEDEEDRKESTIVRQIDVPDDLEMWHPE